MKQDGTECHLLRTKDADIADACEKHFKMARERTSTAVKYAPYKKRTGSSLLSARNDSVPRIKHHHHHHYQARHHHHQQHHHQPAAQPGWRGVPGFSCEKPISSGAQHRGACVGKREGRTVFTKLSKDCNELEVMKNILQSCRVHGQDACRNLVTLVDGPQSCTFEGPYLIMDAANSGDLYKFIANTQKPGVDLRRAIIHGVNQGLTYLHNQARHVHCDIKPENILLHNDGQGLLAKISDFGTVVPVGHRQQACTPVYCTSVLYGAPAMPARDMFALVLIAYEMYRWNETPLRITVTRGNEFLSPETIQTLDHAFSRAVTLEFFPSARGPVALQSFLGA